MKFFESFIIALRSLMANKLRSSLTMLGIIIGVGAVITLVSVGRGAMIWGIPWSPRNLGNVTAISLVVPRLNFTKYAVPSPATRR